MAEMTQDDFARSIGMEPAAFDFLLHDLLQQRSRPDYIKRTLRQQFNHRVTTVQLAAARQWFEEHPDPYYSIS
jgi:hypothetical protein